MSAPTDRVQDPNSVSYYAPRGARPARLGQVSEAVAGLVPEEPHDNRTSLVAAGDVFEGDAAIQRLRARRSLDPDFAPAPPVPLRSRSWLAVASRLAMVMLAAAVVALMAIGQLPLPDFWSRQSNSVEATASRSTPSTPARRSEALIPRLNVLASRGTTGEPAPLGVTLQGRADGGVVLVSGLVAGMTLSTGSPVGANAWQVPVSDLGNTWILPPKDFVGVVELVAELHLADTTIAHRRPIRLEWVGGNPGLAAQGSTSTAMAVAPAVATIPAAPAVAAVPTNPAVAYPRQVAPVQRPAAVAPVQRQLEADEVASLVKRGKEFIANGDLAAARLVLRRAAEANNAEAALTLAATYDPFVLRELKVYGFPGDVAMARAWYEKARDFGSTEAPRRLETLTAGAASR